MRNKFILLFLCAAAFSFAAERTPEQAAQLAAQFTNSQPQLRKAHKVARTASNMKLVSTRTKLNSTAPAFYVFNQENNAGYVIVAGDDLAQDVLVYSESGSFDPENVNPNFQFWLNRMQEEMSIINEDNALPKTAVQVTAISPLLKNAAGEEIAWYQESPYWNQCPMDLWKTSERCLTGCVATAAAQIMYKWRYPAQGTGSHSYTWECCMNSQCTKTSSQKLSKDFSTVTFDWDNMLATYNSGSTGTTAQKNAVATLMYCCGIACDMQYGGSTINGSGAWTDDIGYGMTQYFGYKLDKFITTYKKSDYEEVKGTSIPLTTSQCEWSVSTSTFTTYFNAELEAGRPILMGGEDSEGGGHEFVCDGRDANGKFHINWGWEGDGNNYCQLSSLKPQGESYNFSNEIDALLGLEPAVVDTVHVTGVSVSPTSKTLKINEKTTLTATVAPANATVKTVTWSTSNAAIATVDASGKVTGVATGNATITATTTDGKKTATCAITVSKEIIETEDCDEYEYEFTKKCSKGENELGGYSWTITLQAGDIQNIDQYGRGQQFGSSKAPAISVSLTTAEVAECLVKKVIVEAAMASQGDGKLSLYIGGKQVGSEQTLTSTSTEYTFTNSSELEGNLEIRLTNTTKALYVKAININPDEPTALDVVETVSQNAKKYVENGMLIIERDGVRYSVTGVKLQ